MNWCVDSCAFLLLRTCFFAIFAIQRGTDKDSGQNWVSFRQRKKLFEAFTGRAIDFLENFLLVRPRTKAALKTILRMVERPYGDGKTTAP